MTGVFYTPFILHIHSETVHVQNAYTTAVFRCFKTRRSGGDAGGDALDFAPSTSDYFE